MLMIVLCHIMQKMDCELAWWFNVGVQIFLCMSGYLYGQKTIRGIADFYNKRLIKILLPYYLVFIPFGIIEFCFARETFDIVNFVKGLILNATIEGAEHLWYVPTILMCYFVTPILQEYRDRVILNCFGLCKFLIGGCVVTFLFYNRFCSFFNPAWVFCYIVGYALGANESKKVICEKVLLATIGILTTIGNAIQAYCSYVADINFFGFSTFCNYNHVTLGVLIFLLLKTLFERMNLEKISSILKVTDNYSYEVYLVHQLIILGPFSLFSLGWNMIVTCVTLMICICMLAWLLKSTENAVHGCICRRKVQTK